MGHETKYLLAIAVAFALTTAPASAQSPAPFTVKPGDRFVFKTGPVEDEHRVVGVETNTVSVKSTIFGDLVVPKTIVGAWQWSGGKFAPRYSETLYGEAPNPFPLEAGRKLQVAGRLTTSRGSFDFVKNCTVQAASTITADGEKLDVVPIRCDLRVLGGDTSVRNYWYAPKLGYFAGQQLTALLTLVDYERAD